MLFPVPPIPWMEHQKSKYRGYSHFIESNSKCSGLQSTQLQKWWLYLIPNHSNDMENRSKNSGVSFGGSGIGCSSFRVKDIRFIQISKSSISLSLRLPVSITVAYDLGILLGVIHVSGQASVLGELSNSLSSPSSSTSETSSSSSSSLTGTIDQKMKFGLMNLQEANRRNQEHYKHAV